MTCLKVIIIRLIAFALRSSLILSSCSLTCGLLLREYLDIFLLLPKPVKINNQQFMLLFMFQNSRTQVSDPEVKSLNA